MKARFNHRMAGAALFAVCILNTLPAVAQEEEYAPRSAPKIKAGAPTGPVPRMADGKPDLSGAWDVPYFRDLAEGVGPLPFTPDGKAAFQSSLDQTIDPTSFCLFPGVPRISHSPFPMEIVQNANRVAFLYEYMGIWRLIPTDGRAHAKNLDATFMGDSVGRWDGDTLVVDVVGLNDRTWLDSAGHPHSDALHVIERYRRVDAGHMAYEVTIDDPKMFTKPWKNAAVFTTLKPGDRLIEYSCDENNRDRDFGHLKAGGK